MRSIILSLIGILVSLSSWGMNNSSGDFRTTKLSVFQVFYSGEVNKSLAQGSPGYGIEFFRDGGGSLFRGYVKGRFGAVSGKQNFLDGATTVMSPYSMYFSQGELGLLLYPVSRRESGTNVYFGAGGYFSYNQLNITTTSTTTNLKTHQTTLGGGGTAVVGVEMIFGERHQMANFEMSYRQEASQLAGQAQFDLSSLTLSIGLGW